jgi:hypothetical protein
LRTWQEHITEDEAATKGMRDVFNTIPMKGTSFPGRNGSLIKIALYSKIKELH